MKKGIIGLTLFLLSAAFIGCTKECDCDNSTGTTSGSSHQQHQIVGKWLCTASTYTVAGQTYSNTIKGYVAEFRSDGIADVPGDASPTTYTANGNTVTLGTGTIIHIDQISSTSMKYHFTSALGSGGYSYTCTFSRL